MKADVRQAFVGVGANLGDRGTTIVRALQRLAATPGITHVEVSTAYETEPVGILDQPKFLNLVAGLETTLAPEAVMTTLLNIERELGRVRDVRWGPRTLDLDLLAFEGETRASEFLRLPHPLMLEREFVTVPLRGLLARPRFRRPCWGELERELMHLPAARDFSPVPLPNGLEPSNVAPSPRS
jgi:2-amino-4-hydroxy-6-hydroxymethyldihydropteridine diphosphokinase